MQTIRPVRVTRLLFASIDETPAPRLRARPPRDMTLNGLVEVGNLRHAWDSLEALTSPSDLGAALLGQARPPLRAFARAAPGLLVAPGWRTLGF
jgi:hypothetical protein